MVKSVYLSWLLKVPDLNKYELVMFEFSVVSIPR